MVGTGKTLRCQSKNQIAMLFCFLFLYGLLGLIVGAFNLFVICLFDFNGPTYFRGIAAFLIGFFLWPAVVTWLLLKR